MITRSLLVLLPAPLIGMALVGVLYPGQIRRDILLKVSLGIGAGFGIVSMLYFCWSLIFRPDHKGFLLVELAMIAILACLLVVKGRNKQADDTLPQATRPGWISWVLLALFLGSLVSWGVSYRKYVFMFPHGTFDAYAIWNLHARMIYRGGADWQEAFSPEFNWKTHPDYPLLTSANIARAWVLLGEESTRVPIVLSGMMTVALLGLLYASIARLRSAGQASLAGLLLLVTPWVPFFTTAQNAEIPLAYFYLAACVLLVFYAYSPQPGFLVLAGLMAGFSAWTKNEGLVFLLSVIIVLTASCFLHKTRRGSLKALVPFLLGAFLPLVVVGYFKIQLAPPGDMAVGQDLAGMLGKLVDPERYRLIMQYFSDIFLRLGEWNSQVIPAILLYTFFFWRARKGHRKGAWTLGLVLAVTFAGYFAIYLVTPHPLEWHLQYSIDRLSFHLFPIYLMTAFLVAGTPEEALDQLQQT